MNQEQLYENIKKLHDRELEIIEIKNKDYSNFEDPFANFRIFGELGFLVRISDKIMRLKQIYESNTVHITDETYEDTLMDLSNYCNLLLSYKKERADLKAGQLPKLATKEQSDLKAEPLPKLATEEKQNLTIKDFTPLVPWCQCEEQMGKEEYEKFLKWMDGQTTMEGGVYPWDLERYLSGGKAMIF